MEGVPVCERGEIKTLLVFGGAAQLVGCTLMNSIEKKLQFTLMKTF